MENNNKTENKKVDHGQKAIALLAKQLNKKPEVIKPEQRIVEDLGADSLDIVELLMELESSYGLSIPDEDASKLKTVGDLVNYVNKNLA